MQSHSCSKYLCVSLRHSTGMNKHQLNKYRNACICVVRTGGKREYVYLNSTLPVYMHHRQPTTNGYDTTKFTFIQLKDKTTTNKKQTKQPLPTIDTHVLQPQQMAVLFNKYHAEEVTQYSSYNDVIAARIILLKYKKQQLQECL